MYCTHELEKNAICYSLTEKKGNNPLDTRWKNMVKNHSVNAIILERVLVKSVMETAFNYPFDMQ